MLRQHFIWLRTEISYSYFCWMQPCWMHSNYGVGFIQIPNSLMRNFSIRLRRLFYWKGQLANDQAQYRFYLLKKGIIHHLANESIPARKPIASPAESGEPSLRKRRALEEISENPTKRQRTNRKEFTFDVEQYIFSKIGKSRISTRSRRIRRRWCKK